MGDLSGLQSREDFKDRYRETYPEDSRYRRGVNAGQLFRFTRRIEEGHYALTYLTASRELLVGRVTSGYRYEPSGPADGHYPHVRDVEWLERLSRDDFSRPARSSMGSAMTVFSLDDHLEEIHRAQVDPEAASEEAEEESEEAPPFIEETKAQADELIADLISQPPSVNAVSKAPWRIHATARLL